MEVLESEHGPGSGLDAAMILLDEVVQILRGAQLCAFRQQAVGSHLVYCSMGCCIAVESNRVRRVAFMHNRLLEEGLRCGHIPSSAESEVNGLPSLVHGPVEIGPLTAYLDVGLIDSPRTTSGSAKTVPPLDELWCIPPDPAQDRRMRKMQPAFGHHLDQITEAELVA